MLQGKKIKCAFCGGTGVQPRSLKSRCISCRGKGEVEFKSPAITCPSCKGKGRSLGALGLACIRCKGVGAVEKEEAIDMLGARLGEIGRRLSWTRKETENKTKEIEKRLKPIRPFVREAKKETAWLEKLGDNLKTIWRSLWEE